MASESFELLLVMIISGFLEVFGGEYCYINRYSYSTSRIKYCSGGCCGSYTSQYCCAMTTSIIGGVVGAVVFIGLIIALIVFCSKSQRGRQFRQAHWGGGRVIRGGPAVTVISTGQSAPKMHHQMAAPPPPYSFHAPPGQTAAYNSAQAYAPLPGQVGYGYPPPPGPPPGAPPQRGLPTGAPQPPGARGPPGGPPPPAMYNPKGPL